MSNWYREFQSKMQLNEGWFAVFRQETGEEGIIHPEPGETLEDVLDRAPEEWSFVRTEEERDAMADAQRRYDDEDYDNYD